MQVQMPEQPTTLHSPEMICFACQTGYYPCLDAPVFMSLFDIEMTYRLSVRPLQLLQQEAARPLKSYS